MFKSKISKVAAAVALSLGAIGAAQAGFVIQAGDFKMTIDAYDSATIAYTSNCSGVINCNAAAAAPALGSVGSVNASADTMGIFSIASITNIATGNALFTRSAGNYLTGIFSNLTDHEVEITGRFVTASATGGTFSLWKNTSEYSLLPGPAVSGVVDLNNNLYPSISGGTLVLTGVFGSGIIAGDTNTTFTTDFNTRTLVGSSSGYIDITGGDAYYVQALDTNSQFGVNGERRDLFASFNFFPTTAANAAGWDVQVTGSLNGNAVPEPGSLALLSLGLLAAGAATRRRNGQGK